MSHLRLVPRPSPSIAPDDACLGAFQQELDYVHRSFRRLGTAPSKVEDLAQDLFVALRRSWNEYDPRRPLRPYLFAFAFRIAAVTTLRVGVFMGLGFGVRFSEKIFRPPALTIDLTVSPLSLLPSLPPRVTADEACLDAFQRELDYVFRTLRRLGTSGSEVEDLAQELFLVLRRSWGQYDAGRPLRPYLFGIAFRIASAHRRKYGREVAFEVVEVIDTGSGPDDALQAKQARALVLTALEQIPLTRRAVLVMHDLDDVPVKDVASALGIPKFTVYSRLRKARHELDTAVRRLTKAEI